MPFLLGNIALSSFRLAGVGVDLWRKRLFFSGTVGLDKEGF